MAARKSLAIERQQKGRRSLFPLACIAYRQRSSCSCCIHIRIHPHPHSHHSPQPCYLVTTSLTITFISSSPLGRTARPIVTFQPPRRSIYGRPILSLSDNSSLVSQSSFPPPNHKRTQRPPSSRLGPHFHHQRLPYHRSVTALHRQCHLELLLLYFHQEHACKCLFSTSNTRLLQRDRRRRSPHIRHQDDSRGEEARGIHRPQRLEDQGALQAPRA
jgi:hypothetical protein